MRSLALLLLGGLAVLAALTFLNVVRLEVNATLPPVSKNLNLSVYPLASARWAASDIYNVTYYRVRFVPGRLELYTVGYFVPRDPGWSARLEAVGRSGAGQYAIALGVKCRLQKAKTPGPRAHRRSHTAGLADPRHPTLLRSRQSMVQPRRSHGGTAGQLHGGAHVQALPTDLLLRRVSALRRLQQILQ